MGVPIEFRVQAGTAELGGWLREGPGTEQALMLHGGPRLNDYLDPLADELNGLLTTAHYQQRGQAPSSPVGPFYIETHVSDAVAVMDELGWSRPVLLGHSWGGHLALHVAVARPDRIGGLVIVDALGAFGDGGEAELERRLTKPLSGQDLARLGELGARHPQSEDDVLEELAILWPHYFGDPQTAPPMPTFRFAREASKVWDSIHEHLEQGTLENGLRHVAAPTLITHGERSPIPLEQSERLAALMPNANLVVHSGKGHFPWLEEPGFLRRHIAAFLTTL